MLDKAQTAALKAFSKYKKGSAISIINYAKVYEERLYAIACPEREDSVEIVIKNVQLDNGMYKIDDLVKGKILIYDNNGISSEDFPEMSVDVLGYNKWEKKWNLIETKNTFKDMLKFVSKDTGILSGVYLSDNGNKCATDSHVMYYETDERVGNTVLSKQFCEFATIMKGDDTITVACSDKYSVIDTGVFCFGSRLLMGNYPNFPAVIPKNNDLKSSFDVNDKKVFAKLNSFLYRSIMFGPHNLVKDDNETVTLTTKLSDHPIGIAFNMKWFNMILGLSKGKSTMTMLNGKMPALIDGKYLIMPLRALEFGSSVGKLDVKL